MCHRLDRHRIPFTLPGNGRIADLPFEQDGSRPAVEAVLTQLLDRHLRAGEMPGRRACSRRCATGCSAGGKRLRPFLLIESAALFGCGGEAALRVGRGARMRALLFAGP